MDGFVSNSLKIDGFHGNHSTHSNCTPVLGHRDDIVSLNLLLSLFCCFLLSCCNRNYSRAIQD